MAPALPIGAAHLSRAGRAQGWQ